jgi:multiple sugar transport system permease protein
MADIAGTSTSKAGRIASRTGTYVLLIVVAFVCIVPFYVMMVNATRTNQEINRGPSIMPGTALVENWQTLIQGRIDPNTGLRSGGLDVPRGFFNSVVVALSSTLLAAYFSALTAYGFAMYRFRGQGLLFGLILSVIMLPPTIMLVGLFKLSLTLNLYDTRLILILPAIASPYTVFFLRQYTKSVVNPSLVEAARIDGAGEFLIFHKVGLPLVLPGIATMSIFGFLVQWNNYLVPLTLLNSQEKYTLPLIIQQLNTTTYQRDFGAMYLGIALSVVPIIIAFAFLSRYLIAGIAFGGVKE